MTLGRLEGPRGVQGVSGAYTNPIPGDGQAVKWGRTLLEPLYIHRKSQNVKGGS